MDNAIMDRLRAANPTPSAAVLDENLRARIMAMPADARLLVPDAKPHRLPAAGRHQRPAQPFWRIWARRHRGWLAAVSAAVVGCVILAGVAASSSPPIAQAFPVLRKQTVLTPADLEHALAVYGVSTPGDVGLNAGRGHPVTTPWGTGYVLTNSDRSVICLLAPGTVAQPWGASCARTAMAAHHGTADFAYAYDKSTRSARFITLVPADATATVLPSDGQVRTLAIHDGVVAFDVTGPTVLTTSVDGHASTITITPSDATPALGWPQPGASSQSPTTAAATTAAGTPTANGQ